MRLLAIAAVLSIAASAQGGPAAAQDAARYPAKPVRLYVPLAAGGVTDIVARIVGQKMSETWNTPVVIENKPGAAGALAAETVAHAPADGYTLIMGTISSHAINASLYRNLRYDNQKDFAPISLAAMGPNMLVVHPSVPAKSVPELIKVLKDSPGKYTFGSAGSGTSVHLAGVLFMMMTGTEMVHVPYKGSAPMTNDLIAGQVQLAFDNMPTAWAQVQAGTLRGLAVTSPERSPTAPDVPTVGETVPDFSVTSWQGLFAPAGVPEDILEKLSVETRRILALPEIAQRFLEIGTTAKGLSRAAFADFVRSETLRWAAAVKASGAQVD